MRPLRIGVMAGGYAIRHTAAALLADGYKRIQPFLEPSFLWEDNGNKEDLRYMKYLPFWNKVKREQHEQLLRLGWKAPILTEPFTQKRLIQLLRDTDTDVLYVIMHGGIVGPTAIGLVGKRFFVNHPAFELRRSPSGALCPRIPEISRGAGAPERLVSVTPEFLEVFAEEGASSRFQMVLIQGVQAMKGDPLSLDSGPVRATGPTAALKIYTQAEADNSLTMCNRISEFMEIAAALSAPIIRDDLVRAAIPDVKEAAKAGMSWSQALQFGYRPAKVLRAYKLSEQKRKLVEEMDRGGY